jgi:hypothetical protein
VTGVAESNKEVPDTMSHEVCEENEAQIVTEVRTSVSSVWCNCNDRHMAWRCWCGKSIYAPQPGLDCRIRDRGPVSMWEDEQRRASDDAAGR